MKNRRGLGYRLYDSIKYYCPLCKKDNYVVFILGWGNFLRCQHCCIKVGNRDKTTIKGNPYRYMRAERLIRAGIEN